MPGSLSVKDWLPSAIGGGVDLLSQGISGVFNAVQSAKQRKWQEKMYSKQLSDTLRMRDESWARQDKLLADERAYNSPENQVALAKQAGLNPALINGGQMTSALSSISSAGTSPEAPKPGDYAYTPIQPSHVGSAAVANYLNAQSVEIAKQNADTSRIQANVQQYKAQSEVIENLANAGNLDADTKKKMLDYMFQAATYDTRVEIVKQELEGVKLDNALKGYDFSTMRPAVYNKLVSETQLLQGEIEMIPYRIANLESDTVFNQQSAITESSRASYYSSQTALTVDESLKLQAEAAYFDALTELTAPELSMKQFQADHAGLTYVFDRWQQGVEGIATAFGTAIYGYGTFAGKGAGKAAKGAGKSVKGAGKAGKAGKAAPVVSDRERYDRALQNTIDKYNMYWPSLTQEKKDVLMKDPVFREKVYPRLKFNQGNN